MIVGRTFCLVFIFVILNVSLFSQTVVSTKENLEDGKSVSIKIERGVTWSQRTPIGNVSPQMAIWVESLTGHYLETIYVTRAFGKQILIGVPEGRNITYRRASLPFWLKKHYTKFHYYPTSLRPLPDSVSKATPLSSFILNTKVPNNIGTAYMYFEVNHQSDYNQSYTNYFGQPSLIYRGKVDFNRPGSYPLQLYAVSDQDKEGIIKTNITGITTANSIVESVTVEIE